MGVLTKKTKLVSARLPLDLIEDITDDLGGGSLTDFLIRAAKNELERSDRIKTSDEAFEDELDYLGGCGFND